MAVVLGGATLGMVVGTPLARLVTDLAGWRAAFTGLAVVGLAVAVLVRLVVARPSANSRQPLAGASPIAGRESPRPMLMLTGLIALVLIGHYGAYTFITRLAEVPAAALPGQVSTLLLVFGIASAIGVALAGRVSDRTGRGLLVCVALTAAALLALDAASEHPVLGLTVLVTWGVVSGAMPPLAQTQILRLAGPAPRSTAGALIPVLFNGAIAIGAGLASIVVAHHGVAALPVPAGIVVAVAATGIASTSRTR